MLKHLNIYANIFNALGDFNRLRVFKLLLSRKEYCVSELAGILGVSVPAVSQQLRLLERSGLVTRERRGQMICYKVRSGNPAVKLIIDLISKGR